MAVADQTPVEIVPTEIKLDNVATSVAARVFVPDGKVALVVAVVVRVKLFAPEVIKVDPSTKVSVADVVGVVKTTLLILEADATPNVGVTRTGDVANTKAPLPVSSEIILANAELVVMTDAVPELYCKSPVAELLFKPVPPY
jgi:hypothetical protein